MQMSVDESGEHPIVVCRFPAAPSNADMASFIRTQVELLNQRRRHGAVIDLSEMQTALPGHRKMTATYLREHAEALAEFRVATAFVSPSTFARGVVGAVMWLQRPPYDYVITASRDDALRWCRRKLTALPVSGSGFAHG